MHAHTLKTTLAVTQQALTSALRMASQQPADNPFEDTRHRRLMRGMMEGAGLMGAEVIVAFVKNDGSLRYMRCDVCPGEDASARYVTVRDLTLTEAANRPVYRRVCLDTIAGVQATYNAA